MDAPIMMYCLLIIHHPLLNHPGAVFEFQDFSELVASLPFSGHSNLR